MNNLKNNKVNKYKDKLLKVLDKLMEDEKLDKEDTINLLANCIQEVNEKKANTYPLKSNTDLNILSSDNPKVLLIWFSMNPKFDITAIQYDDKYIFLKQHIQEAIKLVGTGNYPLGLGPMIFKIPRME